MQANGDDEDGDVYKDVVVIGNGPSGICMSYMLAGNWPHYTGEPHPGDDMLTARLRFATRRSSCGDEDDARDCFREEAVSCDAASGGRRRCRSPGRSQQARCLARNARSNLECLSAGLEGRGGGKPLALLMDQLQHPCVDAGLDVPPLLAWRTVLEHPEHRVVDHVVLGKGQPGGAWQYMDPNVLTISLSRWMSLPGLDLRHWEMTVEAEQLQKSGDGAAGLHSSQEKINACKIASRVSVGTVAAYYKDYVRRQGLEQYFRCGTTVTSVRPVPGQRNDEEEFGWLVEGFQNRTGKRFRYRCKRVVLATGTTDLSRHLGLEGENSQSSWVTHDLNDLESRLDRLVERHGKNALEGQVDPVLVVGAGLSAADAIMAARFRGIPLLHAFRDSSSEWNEKTAEKVKTYGYDKLQWLPSSMYPEYHKVFEMMADGGSNYPLYRSLPGYELVELRARSEHGDSDGGVVTLRSPSGHLHTFGVSIAAILIGYKADLSYLENGGVGLGKLPGKPIDNRSNPIEVDDFTYEVARSPRKGLYALGPLVGDNFVRFIPGGAFGVLAHILSTANV